MDGVKIGTITLAEPVDTVRHYEVAAWHSTVRVPPGTYDVIGYASSRESLALGYFYTITVDAHGECIDDFKPSLFGGVPIGGKTEWDKGQQMRAGDFPFIIIDRADLLPEYRSLKKEGK